MKVNLFAFCIFWGAYLLFQIEPLLGKFILPWFGGSPAVWTTCMLFFQVLLLAGYAYAHMSMDRLPARQQAVLHIMLLVAALGLMPITPDRNLTIAENLEPSLAILILLLSSIGLPFFVLAATSPLLQGWFVRCDSDRSPYFLYALSNLGSLLALISYPFVFEPYFKLSQQTLGWSAGFGLFVMFCIGLSLFYRRRGLSTVNNDYPGSVAGPLAADQRMPPGLLWFFWLSLPAVTSTMLLAVTNQLCQDVASVPFLWIVPLAFYLMSFILCFARHNWYSRTIFLPCSVLAAAALLCVLYLGGQITLEWQIAIYSLGLFCCCMICHGELYRLRPQVNRLTAYYLAISIGGAVGGIFVALLAPKIFPMYFELHIGLFACFVLVWLVLWYEYRWQATARVAALNYAAVLVLLLLGGFLLNHVYHAVTAQVLVDRNFYGVLRVENRDMDDAQQAKRVLRHGAIDHGLQFLAEQKQNIPTAYYWRQTGIGLLLDNLWVDRPRRIGLVGLGVGTLMVYGNQKDYFRIYDINPKVVELAQSYFNFLKASQAEYDIIIKDARLALQHETPQQFDILILDAFSGDAIPMHLLTGEALQLYSRHLKTGGVLAIHITNHYLNLRPLIKGLAELGGYDEIVVHSQPDASDSSFYLADWALLSRNPQTLQIPVIQAAGAGPPASLTSVVWTDDFSNLFRLLK